MYVLVAVQWCTVERSHHWTATVLHVHAPGMALLATTLTWPAHRGTMAGHRLRRLEQSTAAVAVLCCRHCLEKLALFVLHTRTAERPQR